MTAGKDVISKRNMLRLWGMVACLVILAGCGGGERDDAGVTPIPAATATHTPAAETIDISDVTWTTAIEDSGGPGDAVDSFPADAPAIIAAVEVSDVPAGSVMTATWQIDGEAVPGAEMTVTVEQDVEQGWVTFRFVRDGDQIFPLGELEVRIEASDGTVATGEVEIVLP